MNKNKQKIYKQQPYVLKAKKKRWVFKEALNSDKVEADLMVMYSS